MVRRSREDGYFRGFESTYFFEGNAGGPTVYGDGSEGTGVKDLCIFVDNAAVVSTINSGHSSYYLGNEILCLLFALGDNRGMHIFSEWVPSDFEKADTRGTAHPNTQPSHQKDGDKAGHEKKKKKKKKKKKLFDRRL